jgi:membrane-associated phospholipid phosphatase
MARTGTRRQAWGVAVAVVAALVLLAGPGRAQDGKDPDHRLYWREHWPRFRRSEVIYTGAAWASYVMVELFAEQQPTANWVAELPGDAAARRALMLSTRRGRDAAGVASDALWIATQVVVWTDSIVVPFLLDRFNTDVTLQLSLMNLETMGPVGLLSRLGHRYIARVRPSAADCAKNPEHEAYCRGAATSFPSGHAASSFAAAGLTCAHHQHLGLYGNPVADGMACATIVLASSAGGVLRIMADRHWLSDVIVGAGFGFAVGYGLPTLLHYDRDERVEGSAANRPGGATVPLAWSYAGRF